MSKVIIDGIEYVPRQNIAARVSIHGMYDCHCFERFTGMYDCHCFERFTGKTVDEVISNWQKHSEKDTLAYLGQDKTPSNIGVTVLCPAIVLDANDKELRRVGEMVFERGDPSLWRDALLADPDIPRLLAKEPT